MSRSRPYATVLLPTYDRHESLGQSLQSVMAQSVENIQILVVGDGATAEVLDVAYAAAREDERIAVLEFPKGHNCGGLARSRALPHARSDRIVVLQDDDLWLPNHVETMGRAIDGHDVATAGMLAVRASGSVCAWTSNYMHAPFRQVTQDTLFKLVFEGNYAFSLDSYNRHDVGWDRVEWRGNIKRLLDTHLADPDARWNSVATFTSLSFNSPLRHDPAYATGFGDELDSWLDRIRDPAAVTAIIESAQWGGPLFSAINWFSPGPGASLAHYLGSLGVARDAEPDMLALRITDTQWAHLERCHALLRGDATLDDWNEAWDEVLLDLAEPFTGWQPRCWGVAHRLARCVGPEAGLMIAGALEQRIDDRRRHLARGLHVSALLRARQRDRARNLADTSGNGLYAEWFRQVVANIDAGKHG